MSDWTNARKITNSGGMTVVSLPPGFAEKCGLTPTEDEVRLRPTEHGFEARKIEWRFPDA
jgi:hypothetical protein